MRIEEIIHSANTLSLVLLFYLIVSLGHPRRRGSSSSSSSSSSQPNPTNHGIDQGWILVFGCVHLLGVKGCEIAYLERERISADKSDRQTDRWTHTERER